MPRQQQLHDYFTMPERNQSPLNVGVELEWPRSEHESSPTMTQRGRGSRGLYTSIRDQQGNRRLEAGGNVVTDPSVGTELVSGPEPGISGGISTQRAKTWYDEMFALAAEHGYIHEPTGIMREGDGSTAGLHIHISEWDTEQARALYDISFEPWMQVFACSSIIREDGYTNANVFRGTRFCKNTWNHERYSVVHSVDATAGHWEWRLPEPMGRPHFNLLIEFLERFHTDQSDAIEFAQDLVYSADDRLTSIQRGSHLSDGVFVPYDTENTYIFRHPASTVDSRNFYNQVQTNPSAPYIYRVDMDDESYYAFESRESTTFEVESFGQYNTDDIVHTADLEPTDDSSIADRVERAMQDKITGQQTLETSDATPLLREVHPDLPAPEAA